MGNTISVADLVRLRACEDEIFKFSIIFPEADDGVEVTMENVLKALKAGLSLHWLGQAIFTTPAYVEYKRVLDAAWAEYLSVERPAWVEYRRVAGPRWEYPHATLLSAIAEYGRIEKAVGEKYHLAEAMAWVAAYEASVDVAGKGDE